MTRWIWTGLLGAALLGGCGANGNCKDACDKVASCNLNEAGLSCDSNCSSGTGNQGVDAAAQACAECLNGHSCDDIRAGKCARECPEIGLTPK